jgi:hypothetical protein
MPCRLANPRLLLQPFYLTKSSISLGGSVILAGGGLGRKLLSIQCGFVQAVLRAKDEGRQLCVLRTMEQGRKK